MVVFLSEPEEYDVRRQKWVHYHFLGCWKWVNNTSQAYRKLLKLCGVLLQKQELDCVPGSIRDIFCCLIPIPQSQAFG